MSVDSQEAGTASQTPALENALQDNRRLRRTMRDLVALSTLPAIWRGRDSDGIVRSLCDVLMSTLSLDLLYVSLAAHGQHHHVEVIRSKHPDSKQHDAAKALLATLFNTLSPKH